jgi:S-adenosylmethionine synthetase
MRIYLVGRATREFEGVMVPVEDLAAEAMTSWVHGNLRHLDPRRHVELRPLIRAGSAELVELFLRQSMLGAPLANDTSVGVGFAPLTDLESVVAAVEATLGAHGAHGEIPEIGEDIKVMGVRRGAHITLTVASALLGHLVPDLQAYLRAKERIRDSAVDAARTIVGREVTVDVNTADDPDRNSVYITVTGTSAEAGDDGEAGRGNRANGLITPYRPMTLESVAGKNPVNHVGKLYPIAAQRIADALISEVGAVMAAECVLVARIGCPIDDPQVADVRIELEDGSPVARYTDEVEDIVRRELDNLRSVWREFTAPPAPAHGPAGGSSDVPGREARANV